jgi:hypothetical protein
MPVPYRELLQKVRVAFPQPVSDRVHDSYFVHSIMRALDRVDEMKSEVPLFGQAAPLDYTAAHHAELRPQASAVEDVTRELVSYLQGMTIFGHPRQQQNVVPPTSIPSLIGVLLASLSNPNMVWDEFSRASRWPRWRCRRSSPGCSVRPKARRACSPSAARARTAGVKIGLRRRARGSTARDCANRP